MTYAPPDRLAKHFSLDTTKCPQAVHQFQVFNFLPHSQSLSHIAEQSGWRVTNMAIEAYYRVAISIIPYLDTIVNLWFRLVGAMSSVGDSPRHQILMPEGIRIMVRALSPLSGRCVFLCKTALHS